MAFKFPPDRWPLSWHKPLFFLPFRFGSILVSVLAILLSTVFSVMIWYEYGSGSDLPTNVRTSLAVAAAVQMIFVLIAALGVVALVKERKTPITAFAFSVFGHFIANAVVIVYFLSTIMSYTPCHSEPGPPGPPGPPHPDSGPRPRAPCQDLFFPRAVYIMLSVLVLLRELYHGVVIINYLCYLRDQGNESRSLYLETAEDRQHLVSNTRMSFTYPQSPAPGPSSSSMMFTRQLDAEAAEGYGGGRLQYDQIRRDEKARMQEAGELGSEYSHHDAPPVVRRETSDRELPLYSRNE